MTKIEKYIYRKFNINKNTYDLMRTCFNKNNSI